MQYQQYETQHIFDDHRQHMLYNQPTEPTLNTVAPSLPTNYYLREARLQRPLHGLSKVLAGIVRKINQLLGFTFIMLLLLLLTRFLLTLFGLTTSLIVRWIYDASNIMLIPFDNILPKVPYHGMMVDVSVMVAMGAYRVVVVMVRWVLRVLVARV